MIEAARIVRVHAREVLDSRGQPTVEVEVECQGGLLGRAIVPAGASAGTHEAVELRDGDPRHFDGKGVLRAVRHVREILGPALLHQFVTDQADIDRILCELDGTPNKSRLGANAILGVSLAVAHAAAAVKGVPLWQSLAQGHARMPLPMVNLISGGKHAGGQLDFQDYLLLPIGAKTYSQALHWTVTVYRTLGRLLTRAGHEGVLVGDEGGYGPKLADNEQALQLIVDAIDAAGLRPGIDAAIALDVAATHFYHADSATYHWRRGNQTLTAQAMIDHLEQLVERYPIFSIEDGLAEDDWAGWKQLTDRLGKKVQLIGDDLFVTHPARLQRGIASGVANAVLVKPNQIGTLSETCQVVRLAQSAGYRTIISARSGETEDTTIADLAVALGAGQIKIGSVARSERLAKYNQLLRIEERFPTPSEFAAWQPLG